MSARTEARSKVIEALSILTAISSYEVEHTPMRNAIEPLRQARGLLDTQAEQVTLEEIQQAIYVDMIDVVEIESFLAALDRRGWRIVRGEDS